MLCQTNHEQTIFLYQGLEGECESYKYSFSRVQGPQPAPHPYPPASSLTKPRKDIHRGKMNASKIPHSYTLIPIEIETPY